MATATVQSTLNFSTHWCREIYLQQHKVGTLLTVSAATDKADSPTAYPSAWRGKNTSSVLSLRGLSYICIYVCLPAHNLQPFWMLPDTLPTVISYYPMLDASPFQPSRRAAPSNTNLHRKLQLYFTDKNINPKYLFLSVNCWLLTIIFFNCNM